MIYSYNIKEGVCQSLLLEGPSQLITMVSYLITEKLCEIDGCHGYRGKKFPVK